MTISYHHDRYIYDTFAPFNNTNKHNHRLEKSGKNGRSSGGGGGGGGDGKQLSLEEINKLASDTFNTVSLATCEYCGRSFLGL